MFTSDTVNVTTPDGSLVYQVEAHKLTIMKAYTVVDASGKVLVTMWRAFLRPRLDVISQDGTTAGTLRSAVLNSTYYIEFKGYPAMKIDLGWGITSKKTYRILAQKNGNLLARATSDRTSMSVQVLEKENAFPVLMGLVNLFYDYQSYRRSW